MGRIKEFYMDLVDKVIDLRSIYHQLFDVFKNVEAEFDIANAIGPEHIVAVEQRAFTIWQEEQDARVHLVRILESFLEKDSKISVEQLLTSNLATERTLGKLLLQLETCKK